MKEAPRLRGGVALRAVGLFVGLSLMSVAIVSLLESRLGLAPWDVLHLGIAEHSALTIGTAGIVVGLAALVVAWALGQRPGFGTIANAVVIGVLVDLIRSLRAVEGLGSAGPAARSGLLVVGVLLFGLGTALYIGSGFGAGPRDSLMLVLVRRTGVRIGVVRGCLEVLALSLGFALGGVVGLGTVAVALLVGPLVEASFWLFLRLDLAVPPADLLAAPAGAVGDGVVTVGSLTPTEG